MISWFQIGQLGFAAFLAAVIGERVRALYLRDAISDEGLRWLLRRLEAGDRESARLWARARPRAQLARLLEAALAEPRGDEPRELSAELREETTARLRLLRVCATLASTLGLMGGILTLARGGSHATGLVALQAGGAERAMMNEAIASMAIGVATSAVCFQALALLRPAAQKLLQQARQLERALPAAG